MTLESGDPTRRVRTIDVAYPFTGRWLVQNSPANRVPSHGTSLFASAYAVDFVPITHAGRTAPITARSLFVPETAELFPGFGRPILAPVDGRIVGVRDGDLDHPAFRGLPSLWYAAAQRSRLASGWAALAGNHVMIETRPGVVLALCHLRQGSIQVRPGSSVAQGDLLGGCGNSGNSTEPHLHVQAMSVADPVSARAVRISFDGAVPPNGSIIG